MLVFVVLIPAILNLVFLTAAQVQAFTVLTPVYQQTRLAGSVLKMSTEAKPSFAPWKKWLIKRTIPGAGKMTAAELNKAGCGSRQINHDQGSKCVWINSFVVENGTYCVYAAANEEDVKSHAECLTPDAPFEIMEVTGTLDVTGAYLRNDECAS